MAGNKTQTTTEAESWAKNTGKPGNHHLVAQVFFKTDEHTLDAEDTGVMGKLISAYKGTLLILRVELIFVGHGDHRASGAYNKSLAQRRAQSVKEIFDRQLSGYLLYTSWESRGELDAAQGKVGQQRMAYDRRVDVFSSYIPPVVIEMEPLEIVAKIPDVRRIVSQRWNRWSCSDMLRAPITGSDIAWAEQKQAIEGLLRSFTGGKRAYVWGDEDKDERGISEIPADHTVNQVNIRQSYEQVKKWSAECEFWNLEIDYIWGKPRPNVRVELRDDKAYPYPIFPDPKNPKGPLKKTTTSTKIKVIPRSKADSDPSLFPPDPSK